MHQTKLFNSWYASLQITSRTQQPIGCKWRIDWFYVTYNQSAVGSSEDIAVMHIMNRLMDGFFKAQKNKYKIVWQHQLETPSFVDLLVWDLSTLNIWDPSYWNVFWSFLVKACNGHHHHHRLCHQHCSTPVETMDSTRWRQESRSDMTVSSRSRIFLKLNLNEDE